MNTNKPSCMKKYILFLPIFLLFIAASCSEEASSNTDKSKEQVEEKPKKALEEREPEVKEYLDAVDTLVGEYLVFAEKLLDQYDKVQDGDVDVFEQVSLLGEMSNNAIEIQRLTGALTSMESKKEGIEAKLDAEDIIELGLRINEKMQKYTEIMERVSKIDMADMLTSF